jgi:hypothetical protein
MPERPDNEETAPEHVDPDALAQVPRNSSTIGFSYSRSNAQSRTRGRDRARRPATPPGRSTLAHPLHDGVSHQHNINER